MQHDKIDEGKRNVIVYLTTKAFSDGLDATIHIFAKKLNCSILELENGFLPQPSLKGYSILSRLDRCRFLQSKGTFNIAGLQTAKLNMTEILPVITWVMISQCIRQS